MITQNEREVIENMIRDLTGCGKDVDITSIHEEVIESLERPVSSRPGLIDMINYMYMVGEYDLIEKLDKGRPYKAISNFSPWVGEDPNKPARYVDCVIPMAKYKETLEKHRSCALPSWYLELNYTW